MYEQSKIYRGMKVFKTMHYGRTESALKDELLALKQKGYKAFIIGETDKLSARGNGRGYSIWADENWFKDENRKSSSREIKIIKDRLDGLEANLQKQLEELQKNYELERKILQAKYDELMAKYTADQGGAVIEKKTFAELCESYLK
jgi:hypothetical protein